MSRMLPLKSCTAAMIIASALIFPPAADAQKSVYIRHKPTVATATASIPFAISAEITPEGLRGTLHMLGGLTLKRGVVGATADGDASAAYFVTVTSDTTTPSDISGEVSLDFARQTAAGSATTIDEPFLADLRIDPDGAGQAGHSVMAFDIVDRAIATSPEVLELRFAPSSETETLVGEPSRFFNSPRPGQDLIFTAPPVQAGSTFETTLTVGGQSSPEAQIRIKVKHGI
ncbi:MAG: hypothetical protein AAFY88_20940 [Acidobacteriota bacterium]